jgi:hypothetical protein
MAVPSGQRVDADAQDPPAGLSDGRHEKRLQSRVTAQQFRPPASGYLDAVEDLRTSVTLTRGR